MFTVETGPTEAARGTPYKSAAPDRPSTWMEKHLRKPTTDRFDPVLTSHFKEATWQASLGQSTEEDQSDWSKALEWSVLLAVRLWGLSGDSSICFAAIHDGRIPATGGEVTVYKLPGQSSYQASNQHGVRSNAPRGGEEEFLTRRREKVLFRPRGLLPFGTKKAKGD
ncbi:dendrite reproteinration [Branchiostoma belcheri]|nr:dendrite reproteinration [Branchiostoma belcheri]